MKFQMNNMQEILTKEQKEKLQLSNQLQQESKKL